MGTRLQKYSHPHIRGFSISSLQAAGGKYKNFGEVTQDALVYAAAECKVQLSTGDITDIMGSYSVINVWPDVVPAAEIERAKIEVVFCSNMTEEMLRRGLNNSGTESYFDHVIRMWCRMGWVLVWGNLLSFPSGGFKNS